MAGHAGLSGFVREEMWVNRGLIGRQSGEIKDLRPARRLK
jgi:hypothetical protein